MPDMVATPLPTGDYICTFTHKLLTDGSHSGAGGVTASLHSFLTA